MARKNLLAGLTAEKLTAVNSPDSSAARPPALVGRGALGAVTRGIDDLRARAQAADRLEERLTAGQVVVELDASLIDPSFIQDRMEHDEEAHRTLLAAIADQGQISPVLVRPHPTAKGRYQVACGHRRLRVAQELGRPVRAVVKRLSDRELVLAQGQENSARTDLSFIERARFARRLEAEGYDRPTIMAALAVDKTTVSRMISVTTRVPDDVVDAIGPAPGVGRDRWVELAGTFPEDGAPQSLGKLLCASEFTAAASDDRFSQVQAALSQPVAKAEHSPRLRAARPEVLPFFLPNSRDLRAVEATKRGSAVILSIDLAVVPGFSDFLLGQMDTLLREYVDTHPQAGEKPRSAGRKRTK